MSSGGSVLFKKNSMGSLTAHQIYKKYIAENLSPEQYKQLLLENGILVKKVSNQKNKLKKMNILSYKDVENYLQNRQVYFKKEIANSDLQTIAESGKVHNVGKVQLTRLNDQQIAFDLNVNGITTTMYEYKTDLELFAWVKTNFIPVCELVKCWLS